MFGAVSNCVSQFAADVNAFKTLLGIISQWLFGPFSMLCQRAENPAFDAVVRLAALFTLVTTLSKHDCDAHWRRVCNTISLLPAFFTLDQLLASVRHLSALGSWQAWVIAHQMFVNYNNGVLFDGLSISFTNHSTMSTITAIAEAALTSTNPTIVSNAALIYVGLAAHIQREPVIDAVRIALVSVRDRLPPTYARERNDVDQFLARDTHLRTIHS
jgi:hypothetical protein